MNLPYRSTTKALLLLFFFVTYSFAGTVPKPDGTSQVVIKYGIDEHGRSFAYTAPVNDVLSPVVPGPSPRPATRITVKRYGIDEHGRSFEYQESPAPHFTTSVAATKTAPLPATATAPRPGNTVTAALPATPSAPAPTVTATTPVRHAPVSTVRPSQGAPRKPAPDSHTVSLPSTLARHGAPARDATPSATKPVAARPAATAAETGAPTSRTKREFVVMVSTGTSPKSEQSLHQELKRHGAPLVQSRVDRECRPIHRLLYARYEDRNQAYGEMAKIRARGEKAYIISDKGGHTVYCGSFYREKRAQEEQEIIAGRGTRVTIRKESAAIISNYLMARGFDSRATARKLAETLQRQGIRATVMSADQLYAQKNRGTGVAKG